ncbi:MAG: hypothetical protein OXH22_03925 [Chloroflexi bacterium]|nr:hypothetical protein [Chloroflexota bacterium]
MFGFGMDVKEQLKKTPNFLFGCVFGWVAMGIFALTVSAARVRLEESDMSELVMLAIMISSAFIGWFGGVFLAWVFTVWIYRSKRDDKKWHEKYPDWKS